MGTEMLVAIFMAFTIASCRPSACSGVSGVGGNGERRLETAEEYSGQSAVSCMIVTYHGLAGQEDWTKVYVIDMMRYVSISK